MSFFRRQAVLIVPTALLLLATALSAQQLPEAVPASPAAYQQTYDQLLQTINAIPIFDNHGHPGFADDPNVDAMASPQELSTPFRLRGDNPELITASKALFGYPYTDHSPEHLQWLVKKKARLLQEQQSY